MKRILMLALLTSTTVYVIAQKPESLINAKEAERIERVLASDEMKGRKTFSPEIDKAADFIATEFKAAGLQPAGTNGGYRQEFSVVSAKQVALTATVDGQAFNSKDVVVVTNAAALKVDQSSGYDTATIKKGANIFQEAIRLSGAGKNYVVYVDTSFRANFTRLTFLKRNSFRTATSVIFILTDKVPASFSIDATHEINEQKLANVVGILPGKSKKDEYVIFSGHYDHIGIGKALNGDSIYNGANDDAAGTTAVILLARYFKALKNNERTIVFAAFTAEEIGGYGSQYFSKQYPAEKVAAMFNIEMIGTESKWGKNSAYITGYEKTDMGTILQKNLEGTGFTFHPDPYTDQQLFYRSDNATLARLGVPAHTISTAKMDTEPHYHKASDQVETLDLENMAMIIRSIALSSRGIVAGKESPSSVKVDELTR